MLTTLTVVLHDFYKCQQEAHHSPDTDNGSRKNQEGGDVDLAEGCSSSECSSAPHAEEGSGVCGETTGGGGMELIHIHGLSLCAGTTLHCTGDVALLTGTAIASCRLCPPMEHWKSIIRIKWAAIAGVGACVCMHVCVCVTACFIPLQPVTICRPELVTHSVHTHPGQESATPSGLESATPSGQKSATPSGQESATPSGQESATPSSHWFYPSPSSVQANLPRSTEVRSICCYGSIIII